MNAADTIREYYDALRNGNPLSPYFLEDESTTKFGVSESLFGYDDVEAALREQTETTSEWTVDSRNLVVTQRDETATFADEVGLGWTEDESGDRNRFETRWSGSLERTDDGWKFRTMHVSAPREL